MILRLGPLTLMSSSTREAYANLANAAYRLHQTIWYADDLCFPNTQVEIKHLDQLLSDAISHTPPEDIQT